MTQLAHRLGHHDKLLIFIGIFVALECGLVIMNEMYLLPLHRNAVVAPLQSSTQTTSSKETHLLATMEPKGDPQPKEKPRGWDPGATDRDKPPVLLTIPTPIWVLSLPKSGTTSMWQYFQCGRRAASHQWTKSSNGSSVRIGMRMQRNVQEGRPLFENCGDYDVYSDTGYSLFVRKGVSECYYPSITALPNFYESYPNGTLILITRNSTSWHDSMQAWGGGSLLLRWQNCNITTTETAADFYDWHTRHIRDFSRRHPSLTYLEFALETPHLGRALEQAIGIPASCWGKCRPESKYCQRVE